METRRNFLIKGFSFSLTLSLTNIFSFLPVILFSCARKSKTYNINLKKTEIKNALVIWYSQTGHTRRYALLIAKILEKNNIIVDALDFRNSTKENFNKYDLIIVGTPVYYYNVPEIVRDFFADIPDINGIPVASFVSFGNGGSNQYNSALTLIELLTNKGGLPIGVDTFGNMATFPPSWNSSMKYKDLPNEKTYDRVRNFALTILNNIKMKKNIKIQKKFGFGQLKKRLGTRWLTKLLINKHEINDQKCISCGTCISACPSGAISLSDLRIDSGKCHACFGCLNNCPVQAIEMEFIFNKLYGFRDFLKKNKIIIKVPEELQKT